VSSWSLALGRPRPGRPLVRSSNTARARELAPGNPLHIEHAATIAAASGRRAEAVTLARRALALEPNLAGAHLLLAEFAATSGELGSAREHAERAVALAPASSPAWNGLGNVRWMLGDTAAARSAYRRALTLDPGNEMAAANLARLAR